MSDEKTLQNKSLAAINISELKNQLKAGPKNSTQIATSNLEESGPRVGFKKMILPAGKGAKNGDKYRLNVGVKDEQLKQYDYMKVYNFGSKGGSDLADFVIELAFELYAELHEEGIELFERVNGKPDVRHALELIEQYYKK